MRFYMLTFILVATIAVMTLAEPGPEPEPAKAFRYRAAQIIDDSETAEDTIDNKGSAVVDDSDDSTRKGDASSGRLFFRKFLLFKNLFGNNQQQPVIPIIITGGEGTGSGTFTSPSPSPTTTSTSTVTGPSGTITSPALITSQNRRPLQSIPRENYDNNSENDSVAADVEAGMVDNETIAAALASGAEEYVVTDQEIKGTSDSKDARGPARVNLRRRGAKNGQVVSVRVPPKYRRYFQNGQQVVVNNKNRPAKRRVVKKRITRNRNRKNKNKRSRVIAD